MKLLKTTVAIVTLLVPLVLGVADASAQERRGGDRGGISQQGPRGDRGFRGGGDRGQGSQGGQRFQGRQQQLQGGQQVQGQRFQGQRDQGAGGQGWRGQGGRGQGQGFQGQGFQGQRFQGQAPNAAAPPVQPNVQQRFQGRGDRGGFDGRQNFRGGDNRFDGRNFDRGGRDWNNNNNRFDGRGGFDNRRGWNDNRFDNRRGERFSYRGRDFFRFRSTPYIWPQGFGFRSWAPQQILPPLFLNNQYFMDDFVNYGLDQPPYGYRWVQVGQDALLVDVYSGEILDVVPGVFYW